ncbi:MAG TPA: acyl-CoA dehydrogenase family protein [Burkholderiales bacterium]|nr:acyl-CoA dehydrogenase family protein [Burkholderiales bacterium]
MSDPLLRDTAERLFAAQCTAEVLRSADQGKFPRALWDAIERAGYAESLVPEESGGPGLAIADALSILVCAGRHAAPVPLAETMLAAKLLAAAGLERPAGPLTIAPVRAGDEVNARRDGARWRLDGAARRVPWASAAAAIVVVAQDDGRSVVACVRPADARATGGANVAGEPREDVAFGAVTAEGVEAPIDASQVFALGAVMRSAQMAGALQRVLEESVRYASERVQFGRPIGRFQAVQQSLALLAGHAAAATAAAEAAMEVVARDPASPAIAAAKIRAGEAASVGAAIAHQVHGAIGFTQEHVLHHFTRRLWSWRDEFGSEARWSVMLGGAIAAGGADRLWQTLTEAGA